MLATTIPITRTTHSRLTPELRDNAPFGAVFSDHMLVADWANGSWSEPQIVPYGTLRPARRTARRALRPGHLRRVQGLSPTERRRGAVPARCQSCAHESIVRADGDARGARVALHRRHARAGRRRSRLDSRQQRQRALRPSRAVRDRRHARRASLRSIPLHHRNLSVRPLFLGQRRPAGRRDLRARVSGRNRRGQVRRQLRRQHARGRARRRSAASTTCSGSMASSAATSKKPG